MQVVYGLLFCFRALCRIMSPSRGSHYVAVFWIPATQESHRSGNHIGRYNDIWRLILSSKSVFS